MWGMLGFGGRGMTQGKKCLGDIARHGDIKVTGLVVPVNFKAEATETGPVLGERILGGESSKKMIRICARE